MVKWIFRRELLSITQNVRGKRSLYPVFRSTVMPRGLPRGAFTIKVIWGLISLYAMFIQYFARTGSYRQWKFSK